MGGAVVVYLLVVAPVSKGFLSGPEAKIQPLNCLWQFLYHFLTIQGEQKGLKVLKNIFFYFLMFDHSLNFSPSDKKNDFFIQIE